MYRVKINVTFNYGGWQLWFTKVFNFDFVPFYGLQLLDITDEHENIIRLENTDYCDTEIYYDIRRKEFGVDVRNKWKQPVADETIDSVIEMFQAHEWDRLDTTNIEDLKELMHRNQNRL